jgi:endonuclease YncB( thermonuclease family)
MRFFSYLILTFCIFWNAGANAAETFSVLASDIYVIDGDTVGIGDSRYRLAGIDACERAQRAINASGRQPSGQDINAQMVSSGWAVAYYSGRYPETRHFADVSAIAQSQGAGLWAGEFVIPSQHRKNPDATPDTQSLSIWGQLAAFILSL